MSDENDLIKEEEQAEESVNGSEQAPDEAAQLKDQLLRTMAELENLRKRTAREQEETAKYAVTGFARDILNVCDNLRRALEAVPAGAADEDQALKSFVDGVELTENELLNILGKYGVKKIIPNQGDEFDHNLHQAMLEIESDNYAPGAIAVIMQAGYVIHDRLLRPALVGIAKKKN